jgi:ribosomal protein S18 acetylase RimI-like enzyme
MAQFFVLNTWQVKLTFLLYGNSTDLGITVGKNPSLWGMTVSFIISFIVFLPLILLILRSISANTWLFECKHHIVASVKLFIYPQSIILMNLYVTPMYRRQGIGSALVNYIKHRFSQPIYLTCIPSLVTYYKRLGFVSISSDRLFSFTTNGKLVAMVSDHNQKTNHQESQ